MVGCFFAERLARRLMTDDSKDRIGGLPDVRGRTTDDSKKAVFRGQMTGKAKEEARVAVDYYLI